MEKRALIFLLGLFILITGATTTYAMTCSFEHIAMVGYPHRMLLASGPAKQAYGEIWQADWGPDGEIYFVSKHHPGVFVIKDGIISRIAGMERRGYRDGPAEYAMFNGKASGYTLVDIAVDSLGNIYVSDGRNQVIRKVFKDNEDKWMVSTFAGGGTTDPILGETVLSTDLFIWGPIGIAVDSNDYVWINSDKSLIKINSMTRQATTVCDVPESFNSREMTSDENDVIYGLQAPMGDMWKYSEEDGFSYIIDKNRNFDGGTFDGPIENASTGSDGQIVTIDGSVIYFGGPDAAGDFRKIEDEGDGLWVKSLMPDDTWQELTWDARAQGKDCGAPVLIDETGSIYLTHSQFSKDTTKLRKMTCIP